MIFNFVAANMIEGRALEKLQKIRDARDDHNVVGEALTPAHIERVLRDDHTGRLGDAVLEERLLRDVDEEGFRAICQNAPEGLASKTLNLQMLIERPRPGTPRETTVRFLREAAELDLETRRGVTPHLRPGSCYENWNCPHLPTAIRAFPLTEGQRRSTTSNG